MAVNLKKKVWFSSQENDNLLLSTITSWIQSNGQRTGGKDFIFEEGLMFKQTQKYDTRTPETHAAVSAVTEIQLMCQELFAVEV